LEHFMSILNRRNLLKASVVTTSALAASSSLAPANAGNGRRFDGGWSNQGQPCAIFKEGSMLLVVNEVGSLGTAKITGPGQFVTLGGSGWEAGLVGTLTNTGTQISWSNGSVWSRD
jgi:hypothetical protein